MLSEAFSWSKRGTRVSSSGGLDLDGAAIRRESIDARNAFIGEYEPEGLGSHGFANISNQLSVKGEGEAGRGVVSFKRIMGAAKFQYDFRQFYRHRRS